MKGQDLLAVAICLMWVFVVPCYGTGSVCCNDTVSGFVIKLFQFFQPINEPLPSLSPYAGDPMYVLKTFSKTKKSGLQINDL